MRTLALLTLAACTADPVMGEVSVVRLLSFQTAASGTSPGFDLDSTTEPQCGVSDYQSPDGVPGIDNSFALLLPAIDAVGGDALPELVQASVTSGELMLLLERGHPLDDGCVPLAIYRGRGTPQLGTDGLILPNQTFDIDPYQPGSSITCARWNDTTLEGEGVDLRLPMQVFDEDIDFTLHEGLLHTLSDPAGVSQGLLGGGVDVEELRANVASFDGIPEELHALFGTALNARADLLPDEGGRCTRMSVVMGFEAVPAFIYEDAVRPQ